MLKSRPSSENTIALTAVAFVAFTTYVKAMVLRLPQLPTQEMQNSARKSLHAVPAPESSGHRVSSVGADALDPDLVRLVIPRGLHTMVLEMLGHIANGHAVTIVPIHAELTTQQAAEFLNVSRPHVIKLIELQALPCTMVGTHRRIRFEDLRAYKEASTRKSLELLDELAREAQEAGEI